MHIAICMDYGNAKYRDCWTDRSLFLCFGLHRSRVGTVSYTHLDVYKRQRPNRSAKDAILKVKEYAEQGYTFAVVLDLSKYFDTLNHEIPGRTH